MRLKQRFEQKFDEEIRFFKGMMQGPKTVGAIVPTSSVTARKMASVINPQSGLPVLELGPGTGVITKQILARGIPAEKIYSIEYSEDFYQRLTQDYPGVNFIHGDAFDIEATLGSMANQTFDCVISAVPMLSFPMSSRITLLEKLLDRLPAGRPVVQITYGPVSPIVANPERYHIQHFDFVVRNIPPAQLWIYRRG
ncbi:phospholipid N-methyltransferase PmtA [Peteryoungia ipomoeae]|uniref:Methyltransferase domain-containing protein n=1 Tax=Peteryoungia ipomoeae TaxID=1210932 RepID=A0A4S8P7P5_9HYPH|nr:class I SAM-dependent methyltransferase [Peteryoungia ipomoeae]THV23984.1 methyltransferase domain-containing protein [Peteryoungia ipomoeae]